MCNCASNFALLTIIYYSIQFTKNKHKSNYKINQNSGNHALNTNSLIILYVGSFSVSHTVARDVRAWFRWKSRTLKSVTTSISQRKLESLVFTTVKSCLKMFEYFRLILRKLKKKNEMIKKHNLYFEKKIILEK